MSEFTQSLKENAGKWLWFLPSLVAHTLILGWMIYMIKPQLLGLQEHADNVGSMEEAAAAAIAEHAEASSAKIDSALVEQVAAQIEATQADEVRDKVSELLDTNALLGTLETQKEQEFALLETELAGNAPQLANNALASVAEAQAQVAKAQAEALAAAEQVKVAKAELNNSGTDAAKIEAATKSLVEAGKNTLAAQARAREAQTAITTAQTTAAQQLAFREDKEFASAREAQSAAAAAQADANTKQDAAAAMAEKMDWVRRDAEYATKQVADGQRRLDYANKELKDRNAALERTQTNRQNETDKLAKEEEKLAAAQAQLGQAADDRAKKSAEGAVAYAQKSVANVKKSVEATEKWVKTAQDNIAKSEASLQKAEENLSKITESAKAKQAAYEALPEQIRALQAEAGTAQQQAQSLQDKAATAVAQAAAGAGATKVAAGSSSSSAPPPRPSLEGKTFAQLYDLAVETEGQIAAKYQSIRAQEVAVQRQIPLSEAKKYVDLALPSRPKYEGDPNTPANAQALKAKNAAMENAITQLDSMVALTRSMAFQANNAASANKGVSVSVEDIKAGAMQSAELTAMAGEKEDMLAVDLTDIMKQIEGGGADGNHGADGHHGEGAHSGHGGDGAHGAGGNGASGSGGLGAGGRTGGTPSQFAGFPGYGEGGSAGFPVAGAVLDSVPGRKVLGGDYHYGSKWMYVDSWYVIGPFPNPARRNIDTKFPPESVVDLDANYQLDSGKVLRWRFVRNSTVYVHPPDEQPYAIYYAYTTLWMDQERDMWIATGSDDYSKIWVNNILVWASGQVQKVWKANEGYRKVHFKKGLNHVLYRIENGQHACMWSLMLNMQPDS